LKDRLYPLV